MEKSSRWWGRHRAAGTLESKLVQKWLLLHLSCGGTHPAGSEPPGDGHPASEALRSGRGGGGLGQDASGK